MKDEILVYVRSFLITFFSVFCGFIIVDGIEPLTALFNGAIGDKAVWLALGIAALRSLVKALLTIAFPIVFKTK